MIYVRISFQGYMTYEDISSPVAFPDISGPVTIENVIF